MRNFTHKMAALALAAVALLVMAGGCGMHEGSESQLKEDADSFAVCFYNWHFMDAARFCSPRSAAWMRYACSNVHQADIELLRAKEHDAQVELEDVDFCDDDSTALVSLKVTNYYRMDSIGTEAHLVDEAHVSLPMVIEGGKWMVNLQGLPFD